MSAGRGRRPAVEVEGLVAAVVPLLVAAAAAREEEGRRGGAHFGCMHNEIPRVISPVCQGPLVKKASRGCRRRGWVGGS